jgi:hypothetical protein
MLLRKKNAKSFGPLAVVTGNRDLLNHLEASRVGERFGHFLETPVVQAIP